MKPGRGKLMKRYAILLVVSVAFAMLATACGSDDIAPSDPGLNTVIPDTVFFNLTGSSEVVLFSGRATDNRWVDTVQISFDNGVVWNTAQIDPDPSVRDVLWSYYATNADIPTTSTILIRVTDQDNNETTSSPFTVAKESGNTPASLLPVFSGAADGDVIALSSGVGDAYGDNVTALTIPVNVNLTVLGAGYGDQPTSGGVTPSVAATSTVLEAPPTTASIFSVGADLTLRNIRFVGSENAVVIDGVDAFVVVEDCLFDGQDSHAVHAIGNGAAVDLQFLSSGVDAFSAGSSSRGGLYLEEVTYDVTGSAFYYMRDPQGPEDDIVTGAAIQTVGGYGIITESLFEDNAMAIWASGGSALIESCDVYRATADTTYGINLTGGPGSAEIRRNAIYENYGYGLRVGGEMELVLRRNAIVDNGLSGVLIDSELSNVDLINIDMGTLTDQGRNLFDDNSHPSGNWAFDTQVYVTQATNEGATPIPANYNYWGYFNIADIHTSIVDDGDQAGGRATIAVGNFYISTSEVGP
jgi:hypothetical protein